MPGPNCQRELSSSSPAECVSKGTALFCAFFQANPRIAIVSHLHLCLISERGCISAYQGVTGLAARLCRHSTACAASRGGRARVIHIASVVSSCFAVFRCFVTRGVNCRAGWAGPTRYPQERDERQTWIYANYAELNWWETN